MKSKTAVNWAVFVLLSHGLSVAQSNKMPGYQQKLKSRLDQVEQTIKKGPFQPTWSSLENYKIPVWYLDAKFGIFIHWGVYSVPAYGSEWYPREMYHAGSEENQHHVSVYGPPTKFGYKDFVPMFKAERFDPVAWARLFKEA